MLYFHRFRQDYLKFEGSDRLDLINRLSTNQVKSLQENHGLKTVLTSDKGRFVDLLALYNFNDFVFACCSFNNSANVIAHLDKYTIMDDFRVKDMAGTHETILFFGDRADEFADAAFGINMQAFVNNNFGICRHGGRDSIAARNDDAFGGFVFIYSAADKDYWNSFIFTDGNIHKYGLTEMNDELYDEKRIDLGIPAFGKEMTELTNPLECGMDEYVSFTKGCYIGQEVIARLDTYDKISKHLVKLEAENDIPDIAAKIISEDKECGFVTSAFKNSGLGFVKTLFLDYSKKYSIKHNGSIINVNLKPINN
jgi:folate-binding protein YgfZ